MENVLTKAQMLERLTKFADSNFGQRQDCIKEVQDILSKNPKYVLREDISNIYERTYALVQAEKERRKANTSKETLKKSGKTLPKPKKAKEDAKKAEVIKFPDKQNPEKEKTEPVFQFPDSIKDNELGTLVRARNIKNYEDFLSYENGGENIVLAAFKWTKEDIKEYNYEIMFDLKLPEGFKGFDNDMDMCQCLVCCSRMERVICMSRNTEGILYFDGVDIPYSSVKGYDYRLMGSTPFELYVQKS